MAEIVTIVGNVGNDPNHITTSDGLSITRFRVGCTQRVKDRTTQRWVDKHTNWYNVSTFRGLADHAHASIKIGDSVIVTGRITLRAWEANGRQGMSVDIDADAVGHDLRWGTSTYSRADRRDDAMSDGGGDAEPLAAAEPADAGGRHVPAGVESESVPF